MKEVEQSDTKLPKATCSKCGASLAVTGREEKEVVFSTETTEKLEKTRIVISVVPCECGEIEGCEKYVNLIFGELDEMPEQPEKQEGYE